VIHLKIDDFEPIREKETKNFIKYTFGRIIDNDNEITGNIYMPKSARNIKITVEFIND